MFTAAALTVPMQLPDLIGLAIPLIVDALTHTHTPPWVKATVNLLLSAAAGVITTAAAGHTAWQPLLFNGAITFLISVGSYFGWYKPSGTSDALSRATDRISIFRRRRHPRPCPPGGQHPLAAVDHSAMKLGRTPKREDPRTLRLAAYLTAQLPCPPAVADWTAKVGEWPMMANNAVGDCTCAAAGHLIEEWTTYAGIPFTPTDSQILAAYTAVTGYNPSDPSTDQGANELDVLNYWRQTGIAGRKIVAYAAVAPADVETVKQAVNLFGGVYIGIALPVTAQRQAVWDGVPGPDPSTQPGSWGGHAVPVVGYTTNPDGTLATLTCITWGQTKTMTGRFFAAYCDEAYGVVSADFIAASGVDPQGLSLAQLLADLQAIPQPAGQAA